MPRRTKEEARATRERILDTAELVFEQQGVSNTSLNQIAGAAGLSRGAIYWHFEDKADLFHAVLERATLPLESLAGQPETSLAEMCDRMIAVLQQLSADARAARVLEITTHKLGLVDAMAELRARRVETRAGCLADLERACRRAARAGRIAPGVPARIAALGLFAVFDGLLEHWMLDPRSFDLPRTARRVIGVYLRGLGHAPDHRSLSRDRT